MNLFNTEFGYNFTIFVFTVYVILAYMAKTLK